MKVSELIIRCAKDTQDYDADGATYADQFIHTELQDWIDFYHQAQRQLVKTRPDSNYKHTSWQLTANMARHDAPAEAIAMIEITRNMGVDGLTPGKPIIEVPRDDIESMISAWFSETGSTEIELFSLDSKMPRTIWTYPRVHATTAVYVEGVYSYAFTESVTTANYNETDIEAGDQFIDALGNWMKRCSSMVEGDELSPGKATLYEEAFYKDLGIEFKVKNTMTQGTRR